MREEEDELYIDFVLTLNRLTSVRELKWEGDLPNGFSKKVDDRILRLKLYPTGLCLEITKKFMGGGETFSRIEKYLVEPKHALKCLWNTVVVRWGEEHGAKKDDLIDFMQRVVDRSKLSPQGPYR